MFTIPKRVKDFTAEQLGVGDALDFHIKFKDELEEPADRLELLRQLARLKVNMVGGMVDVEEGMIYHIGRGIRRLWSYLLFIGAGFLGYFFVYLLSQEQILDLPGFTGDNAYAFRQLSWSYLLTMLGVIGHIVKKAGELSIVKGSTVLGADSPGSIERILLWIHVKEYRFLLSVLVAALAFGVLVYARQLNYINAFITGYFIDSVSDIVLKRYNTVLTSQGKNIGKILAS